YLCVFLFFFQAQDGIRDFHVTRVQTCALPIFFSWKYGSNAMFDRVEDMVATTLSNMALDPYFHEKKPGLTLDELAQKVYYLEQEIGRASCRERVKIGRRGGERERETQRVGRRR